MYALWQNLENLKKMKWVELSHRMNNDSPYWSGIPEGAVELGNVLFAWGNPMLECRIQQFKFPGQFGTHVDFPAHFKKGGAYAESFSMKEAVFPLCVLDISEKAKEDCHYCVTVEDILAYEEKFGRIPEGAFVALRTDWYKNWPDMDKMSGIREDGSENFPGWSLPALKFLYEERNIAANGHETLDTDGSAAAAEAGDLACERYVLSHDKIQIEVLKNLDQVPQAGAILFASWPNFEGANGLPARVFAICEE